MSRSRGNLEQQAADFEVSRSRLLEALRLAAASPDEQMSALPGFVVIYDEIAQSYYDAFQHASRLRESRRLNDLQFAALAALDQLYEEMTTAPDRERLWSLEAMKHDDRWKKSRELAKQALSLLGEGPLA